MIFQDHLLYIDITQICGIGCAFCMYADKHKNGKHMTLTNIAKENLKRLINTPSVKRISISGEGEPLNNIKTFHEILSLSEGGKRFEFITSGFLRHEKLSQFYDETNRIVASNGDNCNIRLSTDSHHIERLKSRPHGFSLKYYLFNNLSNLSFSFRSVDSDKNFTRKYLVEESANWLVNEPLIKPLSVLEDVLIMGENYFKIDYKNLVHPSFAPHEGYLDFLSYISAIESKVNKDFTFGSLNPYPQNNGLDVTIKPDGSVYLYGIETKQLGNIHVDSLSWTYFEDFISEYPLANVLYTKPLKELLEMMGNNALLPHLIAKVNNPYWLIKEMANYDGLLETWESA